MAEQYKAGPAGVEIKAEGEGRVTACVARLGVVDSDGDVTTPGAFTDGEEVLISSYGHASWSGGSGALPVGKGSLRVVGEEAIFDGQFFMDTTAGRETFAVVKALGSQQQWSYGFNVLDSDHGEHDGQRVRFLKRLKVFEVSPVLVGAGVGTRTLAVKAAATPEEIACRELALLVEGDLHRTLTAELVEIKARLELADELLGLRARLGLNTEDAW